MKRDTVRRLAGTDDGIVTAKPRLAQTTASGRRAQSNVLAIVVLLGLTVLGLGLVVMIGGGSLEDSRTSATIERAEGALVSFASQSAPVALGDADSVRVALADSRTGRYDVLEEAGSIRVTHTPEDEDAGVEELYRSDLGTLRYENDGTVVGYQAGGVWKAQGNSSAMVLPPPIVYQDETLTMPLVRVLGDGHVSGPTTSDAERVGVPMAAYPNASKQYGTDGPPYRNPVEQGLVTVTVQSEYYQGWAEYFRSRSGGDVTVDHATESVTLELTAGGTTGPFQMPNEGNAVEIRGLSNDHGLSNFTIILAPDDTDAASFNNLQWAMYVDNGPRELELHLRKGSEVSGGEPCDSEFVSLTLYYSESNGDSYHGWHDDDAFRTECTDRDGDGVADETRLVANLTNERTITMQELSSTDLTHFNPSGGSLEETITFDEHTEAVEWEPATFDESADSTTVRRVTQHYLSALGSSYDVIVDDKNSDTINEDGSRGRLSYDGEGRVTFMHITHRGIRVTLSGGD